MVLEQNKVSCDYPNCLYRGTERGLASHKRLIHNDRTTPTTSSWPKPKLGEDYITWRTRVMAERQALKQKQSIDEEDITLKVLEDEDGDQTLVRETTLPSRGTISEEEMFARRIGTGASKSTYHTAEDLAIAEKLIKAGFAKNFPEMQSKSLHFVNQLFQDIGGLDKMFGQNNKQLDVNEIIQQKMALKLLGDLSNDNGGQHGMSIKDVMQWKMMKDAIGGDKNDNAVLEALRAQITQQQSQMQAQLQQMQAQYQHQMMEMQKQMMDRYENQRKEQEIAELKRMIMEKSEKKNPTEELQKLLDLTNKKDIAIEQAKNETQRVKDEYMFKMMQELKQQVDATRATRGWSDEFSNQIQQKAAQALVKKFDEGLANTEQKKDTGQIIADVIKTTTDKLGPAFEQYMANKASQPAYEVAQNPPIPESMQGGIQPDGSINQTPEGVSMTTDDYVDMAMNK